MQDMLNHMQYFAVASEFMLGKLQYNSSVWPDCSQSVSNAFNFYNTQAFRELTVITTGLFVLCRIIVHYD